MDTTTIQQRISQVSVPHVEAAYAGVPAEFRPWESNLSPSALYACSVTCRKAMGIKTPEVKWMSMKRWVGTTPAGIVLPDGCYLSIKRKETFVARPEPKIVKQHFVLMMFPYGNVWSQIRPDEPITEDWLWSQDEDDRTMFELLLAKDADRPVQGYFKSCAAYMKKYPDQIGIHLRRKRAGA